MNSPINGRQSASSVAITPDLMRTIGFTRVAKGYRVEEVDAFLNAAAGVLAEADLERTALRAEVHRLRNWYRNKGVDVDPMTGERSTPTGPPPHAWQARAMAEQAAWVLRSARAPHPGEPGEIGLAEWTRAYGHAIESHLRAVAEAFAFEAARLAGNEPGPAQPPGTPSRNAGGMSPPAPAPPAPRQQPPQPPKQMDISSMGWMP